MTRLRTIAGAMLALALLPSCTEDKRGCLVPACASGLAILLHDELPPGEWAFSFEWAGEPVSCTATIPIGDTRPTCSAPYADGWVEGSDADRVLRGFNLSDAKPQELSVKVTRDGEIVSEQLLRPDYPPVDLDENGCPLVHCQGGTVAMEPIDTP
jgi:hypothetical protein